MDKKKIPLYIGILIIIAICVFVLSNYLSKKDDNNTSNNKQVIGIKKIKKPETNISKIKLYLEISASMKGYVVAMPDCTAYYKLKDLAMLLPKITQKGTKYELYTVSDKPKIYSSNLDDFTKTLTNGAIFCEKQSRLQNSLCSIIDSLKDDEVGIFISDCILDLGTDGLNKSDLSIATGKLLNHLINHPISVVFYQYFSDFNGNFYYNWKNEQQFLKNLMHKRPLYIWIIGAPTNLKLILRDKILDPGVINSYSYNLKYDTSDIIFQILPYRQKGKMLIKSDFQSIIFKEYSKDNDFCFSVGLDLSSLPKYAQNFDFLITRKNLVLEPEYLNSKLFIKLIDDAKKDPKFNLIAEKIYPNITHLVTIILPKLQETGQIYNLLIKQEEPVWITASHVQDDRRSTLQSLEGKTFGFKAITEAFKQASDTITPLLNIPIKIIK